MERVTLGKLIQYVHSYEKGQINSDVLNQLILVYVSEDKKAIPNILEILEIERQRNRELLLDTNVELSRAFAAFKMFEKNTPTNLKQKRWIFGEIQKHYIKWKDYISCCFNIKLEAEIDNLS